MSTFSFDHLDEIEFENFCYDLLDELGFVNINWRKGTGLSTSPSDRGRDIECEWHSTSVGGKREVEKWFVECKHHKSGVPPEKIAGALAWALAERPDKLLIIASNFLSNPTKDYIEAYKREEKPTFKIEYWEKPNIEQLTKSKSKILRKYRMSGEFPYLSLLHPTHIKCLKEMPFNTLGYFFDCLDKLDPQKRDEIFGFMYEVILRPRYRKAITGKEIIKSLRIDEVNYDLFKVQCYKIARMGGLDQMALVYFIVSFVLQTTFSFADSTSLDKAMEFYRIIILYHEKQIKEEQGDYEENISIIKSGQDFIENLPTQAQKSYDLYVYFCENLLEKLFTEKYLYLERFKPQTGEDTKFYDFSVQWFLTKIEQEQKEPAIQSSKKAQQKRKRKKKQLRLI